MASSFEAFDLWLFRLLTPWHNDVLDVLMSSLSIVGTASALWIAIALAAMWWPRHRAAAWRVLLTLLLCFVTVDLVLKPIIARPRPVSIHAYDPPHELPPRPRTLSFPSGHTAAAFGAAIALSRMLPQARVVWWLLALTMGYARVYVGHHYPLDVVGGAVVGTLVALWVLGGRHPATYANLLRAPRDAIVRP